MLYTIFGFQLLETALRYANPGLTSPVLERMRIETAGKHLRAIERLSLSGHTLPWIAGYGLFQAAILRTKATYGQTEEHIADRLQTLIQFLERICAVLSILSSKFKGLTEHTTLLRTILSMITSSTTVAIPNIMFLAGTDLYGFCESTLDCIGSALTIPA